MDRKYWDRLAKSYDREVFDVQANDAGNVIRDAIDSLRSKRGKSCIDLGCGIGKFLPFLSNSFRKVYAVDISQKMLSLANRKMSALRNVEYLCADASKKGCKLPQADFVLSVNSILTPSLQGRRRMFDNIAKSLSCRGYFLLVVPSLESAMYTRSRLVEWNLKDGLDPRAAVRKYFERGRTPACDTMRQGIVDVDGVPTKHFLKEELIALLNAHEFGAIDVQKINYKWDTEFISPPRWMREPYPWDWMVMGGGKDE